MRFPKQFIAVATFVSFFLFSVPYGLADEDTSSLLWKTGPSEVNLGDQATLRLPEGYRFIGAQDTQRVLRKMGNFPSGSELGLVMATEPNDHWFVVIQYRDAGYIKDDDAANWDADAMLAAIKEGTAEDNKKREAQQAPVLIVRGWEEKPSYDNTANKVTWAISLAEGQDVGVNYNTLALGRYGYMSMNMVGPLDELAMLKPHVSILLSNLNFIEGKRYADFNSATDKVAAVGLSALIAGAAFKSGLLAKLWAFMFPILIAAKKLIIFLVIAVSALVAKLFKKKEPAPQV